MGFKFGNNIFDSIKDIVTDNRTPNPFEIRFENPLDAIERKLNEIEDVVDAVLGDPEEEGQKRGYTKAANQFEPMVREIEAEYDKVINAINAENKSFEQKTDKLLSLINDLEREKKSLKSQRDSSARQSGLSVSELSGFVANPHKDLTKLFINARVAKMKEAERKAYIEACEKFESKVSSMRSRLSSCKAKAAAQHKEHLEYIQDCLNEIENLKKQIAAASVLG